MKTALNLSDERVAQAKACAADENTTLTKIVEEGLILRLRGKAARARVGKKLRPLPSSRKRGGMLPGIDPSSNKSMFDAADE